MTGSGSAQAIATTWTIDADHTHVGFAVRHMMLATVKGRFAGVSGVVEMDGDDVASASVQVEIDAATIDTRNEQRDAHLRSADFFDVANHPAITFRSGRAGLREDGGLDITGELTIRGITREVVLAVEEEGRGVDPWGNERIGFSGTVRIRRSEFGLTWNQTLETGGVLVGDEIRITVDVQIVRSS
ncbi:MAG TPA: YceI family protein [Longimicrobiales bacterium]|nr:YceI family protein [Longimicrobiales bacterium]